MYKLYNFNLDVHFHFWMFDVSILIFDKYVKYPAYPVVTTKRGVQTLYFDINYLLLLIILYIYFYT